MPIHLQVSVASQTLQVWQGQKLVRTYPVSTSKFGTGSEEGSFRTPLGSFEICEKFGDRAPLFTIFKSRAAVGEWDPTEPSEDDLVLTRILRLQGTEDSNANTYDRYIYIHGTNQEERIGVPASHGCIRMNNMDILELYDSVPLQTPIRILAP